MPVEYVAPVGAARLEEFVSLKMSNHILVAGVLIGNAGYAAQQYSLEGSPFAFKDCEGVKVRHHEATVEITIKTPKGAIKYCYDIRMRGCHRINCYDVEGKDIIADPDMVQESYEALVDYCSRVVINQRIAYAEHHQQVKASEEKEEQ